MIILATLAKCALAKLYGQNCRANPSFKVQQNVSIYKVWKYATHQSLKINKLSVIWDMDGRAAEVILFYQLLYVDPSQFEQLVWLWKLVELDCHATWSQSTKIHQRHRWYSFNWFKEAFGFILPLRNFYGKTQLCTGFVGHNLEIDCHACAPANFLPKITILDCKIGDFLRGIQIGVDILKLSFLGLFFQPFPQK